ncbi:MAG TPA: hypothetical protein VKX49_03205 [Bryobacteraceae bacterium]|nr:hypothetical protein [Bryobacteraceae bacterium]
MAEWSPYGVIFSKGSKSPSSGGQVLETVYHVAHVSGARRILEDGYLKAGLIHDKSRLNKSRIAVTWLSANTWAYGSLYGNVQFSLSWTDLIAKKRFYWVEAMPSYSPPAYRILITDRDLSQSKYVQAYDPTTNRGPLRRREGVWYWNGDYTSEFMVERDVQLDECTGFDFIAHHDRFCSLHGSGCKYLGSEPHRAGGRALAFILGNALHSIDHLLKRPSRYDPDRELSDAVDTGITGIMRTLAAKDDRFGGAIRLESSRKAALRGALSLYGSGQIAAARELVSLLKSKNIFKMGLTEIVNEHFDISGWTIEE